MDIYKTFKRSKSKKTRKDKWEFNEEGSKIKFRKILTQSLK